MPTLDIEDEAQMWALARRMGSKSSGLEVRDRYYLLRKYEDCFIASEACDWLIEHEYADSSQQAESICRRLQTMNVFDHVVGDHMFSNDYLFFRFSTAFYERNSMETDDVSSTGYPISLDGLLEAEGTEFYEQLLYEVYAKFRSIVEVKDRRYHLKKYKQCFIGEEAVHQMLMFAMVSSESQALTLGNVMMEEGLLSHVCEEHAFENNHIFYKFNDNAAFEQSFSSLSSKSRQEGEDTTPSHSVENSTSRSSSQDDSEESEGRSNRHLGSMPSLSSSSSLMHLEQFRHLVPALQLCFRLKPLVDLRDRTYRFKTYKQVFVGSTFVQVLLDQGIVATLQEALLLSDRLIHMGFIYHVCNEHSMERGELYYRFTDIVNKNETAEEVLNEEREEEDEEDENSRELLKEEFASPNKTAVLASGFVSLAINPPEEELFENSFAAYTFYMRVTRDEIFFFVNERSIVYAFKRAITPSSSYNRFEAMKRGFVFGEDGDFIAFRFGTKNQFLQTFQAFEYIVREQQKLLPKRKKVRGKSLRNGEGEEKKVHG